jgi:hypothetical protein
MQAKGRPLFRRVQKATLESRLELVATVLLAAAAVLTAWAAFQSAKWSGVMTIRFNEATAARNESAKANTDAAALTNADIGAFLQWLNAYAQELRAGDPPAVDGSYTPDPGRLSGFLAMRFRAEFRPAFDAWIATRPLTFTRTAAPSTPFELPEYRLTATDRAEELAGRGDELSEKAREANQRSDNYVLMTVVFAVGLFFAGVSTKVHIVGSQLILLTLSAGVLLSGAIVVATFPVKV